MTHGERGSIYFGEALQRLMAERPEDKGLWSRSGLLNTIASRYMEVCRQHCPTLTLAEWCVVLDALNGTWMQLTGRDAGLLTSVWANIYDADRWDGLGGKWGCDAKALAERVRGYDYATTVALADAVERWWAADNDGKPFAETIPAVVGAGHVQKP